MQRRKVGGKSRGWSGVSRLRRKLRRMPDEVQAEVKRAMQDATNVVERQTRPEIPVDDGDLAHSYRAQISRDGLSARLGYWEKGNLRNWRRAGWRAHFTIFGTKGGQIERGGDKAPILLPPQPANNFIGRGWAKSRERVLNLLDSGVKAALKRVRELK